MPVAKVTQQLGQSWVLNPSVSLFIVYPICRISSRSGDKGYRLEQAKDRKTVLYHEAMITGGSSVCVCVCACMRACVIGLVEWEGQEKAVEKSVHRSRGSLRNAMSSISNGVSVPKII